MEGSTTPMNAADEMESLGRMDSFDDYFMLNSPPESPEQRQRDSVAMEDSSQDAQQQQQPRQHQTPMNPFDLPFGYFANNEIAPQGNVQHSTLNFTVDRSNAVSSDHDMVFARLLPGTQKDIEEILKLDEKDLNLSELFLQSKHRSSLNSTYQAKGALRGHDNELYRPRLNSFSSSFFEDPEQKTNANANHTVHPTGEETTSNQEQTMPDNSGKNTVSQQQSSLDFDLDVDVEPTPLSEIKAKSQFQNRASSERPPLTSQQLEHHEYQQNRQNYRAQHGSNYYPFGRAYPLPIPTMPPNSPLQADYQKRPALDDAVATAAALASAQEAEDAARSLSHTSNYQNPEHALPPSPHESPSGNHSSWHHTDRLEDQTHNQSRPPSAETQPLLYSQHQHSYHLPDQPPPHPSYQQQHHSSPPSYSHQPHHRTTPLPSGGPPHHHSHKIVGPYTTAQQEGNANSSIPNLLKRAGISSSPKVAPAPAPTASYLPPPPASYLPRRGDHTLREASAAHSAPKGVLTEAAKQRRGYNGYHQPATLQASNAYHRAIFTGESKSSADAKESTSTYEGPQVGSSTAAPAKKAEAPNAAIDGAPPLAIAEAHAHADSAYERKKQRAKDARVKLNESIERLHVSMGVAGTESKKRAEQLRNFMKQAGREDESHTDHQAFELMDSCVKTAESAKKWDRPNFVGSAATMIQCLNSQCEILMKELLEYQETARMQAQRPGRLSSPLAPEIDCPPTIMHVESNVSTPQQGEDNSAKASKRHLETSSFDDNAAEFPGGKRRCLTGVEEDEGEASSATNVGGNPVSPESGALPVYCTPGGPTIHLRDSVMDLIAAFLDPGSLIQCMCVSKSWNRGRCFDKQDLWESLCVKRFGISNSRQWRESHSDDEEDERALMEDNGQGGDSKLEQRTWIKTYRGMDELLIMPWLQRDGRNLLLLGKARLPNAAAWLYLVERSNGETMRSVRRPQATLPSSRNTGVYTSLPVVELRIVLQNTGGKLTANGNRRDDVVVMKDQRLVVDASTRRRGEELLEIDWDGRFSKRLLKADGSDYVPNTKQPNDVLCTLTLFETVVVVTSIHARRCSTSSKFTQRANFLKLLLAVRGTTQPLIIPIGPIGKEQEGGRMAPPN